MQLGRNGLKCKKGGCGVVFRLGYLRFLNSISPSGVVAMYSKPVSISWVASAVSLVALHVHSSDWLRNIACSMFM